MQTNPQISYNIQHSKPYWRDKKAEFFEKAASSPIGHYGFCVTPSVGTYSSSGIVIDTWIEPGTFNKQFVTLLDDRLLLSAPLSITIEREGEFFIAESSLLEEVGYGYKESEAIDDLKITISELYWTLKEEQDRLGTHLKGIWETLRALVKEQ